MLASLMRKWARRRYRREAGCVIAHLSSLDDESMGIVLAIAAHHKNALLEDGTDLRDLTRIARARPMYQNELARAASILQKGERQHDALALSVWVHSLRAVLDSQLHAFGVTIWQHLMRGRRHIGAARENVREQTGFELNITNGTETPREFRV